jgi:signal transduction histidine kinase
MGERGSGLGLSICKNFIEKLDGNIWQKANPAKEVRFISPFRLFKNTSISTFPIFRNLALFLPVGKEM